MQRPILLKGHERAITFLKYNREGDLLFTSAKDPTPCAWYSDNGERIGTYKGHTGAVWSLDVTCTDQLLPHARSRFRSPPSRALIVSHRLSLVGDSKLLLTASADTTVKLWNVENGEELFSWYGASRFFFLEERLVSPLAS